MRRGLIAITMAAIALPAFAQYGRTGPYDDRPYGYGDRGYGYGQDRYGYGQDRYGYGRDRDGYGQNGYGAVSRVAQHLRMLTSRAWMDNRDRRAIERALSDLDRFQYNTSSGNRLDERHLDSAVRHLSDATRSNRMDPRDRDLLARDMELLRNARSGNYGGYNRW